MHNELKSMEKHTRGLNSFIVEARAARALLKFCADHGNDSPAVKNLKQCLAALESGESSNAVAAFKRIPMGKDGFGDWWPPAVGPNETEEHAWAVFEALFERWRRLMSSFANH